MQTRTQNAPRSSDTSRPSNTPHFIHGPRLTSLLLLFALLAPYAPASFATQTQTRERRTSTQTAQPTPTPARTQTPTRATPTPTPSARQTPTPTPKIGRASCRERV